MLTTHSPVYGAEEARHVIDPSFDTPFFSSTTTYCFMRAQEVVFSAIRKSRAAQLSGPASPISLSSATVQR